MIIKYNLILFILFQIYTFGKLITTKNLEVIFVEKQDINEEFFLEKQDINEGISNSTNEHKTSFYMIIDRIRETENNKNDTYFIIAEFDYDEKSKTFSLKKNGDTDLDNFDLKITIEENGLFKKDFKYNNNKIKESKNEEETDEGHLFHIKIKNIYNSQYEEHYIYATSLFFYDKNYWASIFSKNTLLKCFKSIYCFGYRIDHHSLFNECENLYYVKLDNFNNFSKDNIKKYIQQNAEKYKYNNRDIFRKCNSLTEIDLRLFISSSIYNISPANIKHLYINNCIQGFRILDSCFNNCGNLEKIEFTDKKNPIEISSNAFNNCYKLKDLDCIFKINGFFYSCFNNCRELKNLNLILDDYCQTEINNNIFQGTNIQTVNIETTENFNIENNKTLFENLGKCKSQYINFKNFTLEINKETNIMDFMKNPKKYSQKHQNYCKKNKKKENNVTSKYDYTVKIQNNNTKNTNNGCCCQKCCCQ